MFYQINKLSFKNIFQVSSRFKYNGHKKHVPEQNAPHLPALIQGECREQNLAGITHPHHGPDGQAK